MSTLKALKQRINSVKSTKKITSAMKMVATAGLKKYQSQLDNCRSMTARTEKDLTQVSQLLGEREDLPSLLKKRFHPKTHLVVVTSSTRGLCGNFNTRLFQKAYRTIQELREQDLNIELILLGPKIAGLFSLVRLQIARVFTISYQDLQRGACTISHYINERYERGDIDGCTICYMQFKSALVAKSKAKQLIPFTPPVLPQDTPPLFGVEPGASTLLQTLAFSNLTQQIASALLESKTSEESARMIAMDNATRNADDMIDRLEIAYNRTRQADITKELIEIISGAEAL